MGSTSSHRTATNPTMGRRSFVRLALGAGGALALGITGCEGRRGKRTDKTDPHTIRIGASPSPHAIILQHTASKLEQAGYSLEIVEYQDYFKPNDDLVAGRLDANYFQHKPYMDDYNTSYNADLTSAGSVHFEPMCVFGTEGTTLDNLPEHATVTVPNDLTNCARALQLLASCGLVTMAEGAGLTARISDITANPRDLQIATAEAALVPEKLGDSALIVVNGNYAISSALKVTDALARETSDSDAAATYANIVATRSGEDSSPKTRALMDALTSDDMRSFMEQTFQGTVVPSF